jgi:hypothetical protein
MSRMHEIAFWLRIPRATPTRRQTRLLDRCPTLAEARLWINPVPRLPLWTGVSALVVFASGIYLAMRMSAFGQAWIDFTIVALLLIAPLGALTSKRLRAIRHALANPSTCRECSHGHNFQLVARRGAR